MDHGTGGGGWKMWLPMVVCCVAMIGLLIVVGAGVWSFR